MIAPPLLVISVRTLAAIGGLALFLSGECQPIFIAVFVAFFVLGLLIERQERLAGIIGKVQPVLALLMLAIAFIDFFKLSNSFLLAVAHFLLSVQGLRLLALRTPRENLGSVLLSSLTMLSGATLSVDWTYFALFVVFIGVVVWTLMIHTLLDESNRNAAVTSEPMPVQRFVPYIRVSALGAFAIAFVCCTLVFVMFPRFNFQGFRGQFLQPVRKTGFTSQVNLSGGGAIFQDDSVIMRIEIAPDDRKRWSGYIRGQTLDEYQDGVWRRPSSLTPQRLYRSYGIAMNVAPKERHRGRPLHQSIYLESMETTLLFAAAKPVALSIDRPFIDLYPDGALQRVPGDTWRVRYEVDSYPSALDPALSDLSEIKMSPVEGVTTVSALAAAVVKGARTPTEKAQRLTSYLRQNFTYSLNTGPRLEPGADAIQNFLFNTKRGHCEYFASALCLMLRSQNIPSRMATGFLSREWNDRGHYVLVRMKHAHAWVEAQTENGEWVGFDPSPRGVDTRANAGMFGNWSQAMDYLNLRWNRYILSYDFERQVEVVKAVTNTSGSLSSRLGRWRRFEFSFKLWGGRGAIETPESGASSKFRWPAVRTVGLLVVGVFLAWWFLRRRVRPAVWFYPALVHALEKHAGAKVGSETLREFRSKNSAHLSGHASTFDFLIDSYHALRFSAGTLDVDRQAVRRALSALGKNP